jgi:2-desacetyl-2-hydroxyethyl bacteriochlorophyllide A dehydrogenase
MPVERIYDGKGLDPKILALIEPFCIGYHAVKRANVQCGEKVLVVGSGAIGCLAVAGAKLRGAEVTVCDVSGGKLTYAEKMGADHTFVSESPEEFKRQVDAFTSGKGFDVCIEAVGLPSTFQNCIDAAAFRGRVVIVGIGKQSLDFFYSIIQTKELDVMGSRNALKEDFIELIDIVGAGKVNLEHMISDVYDLSDAGTAFESLDKHGGDKLKVLFKF